MQKVIGTLVPISALYSLKNEKSRGTFEDSLILIDWLKRTSQNAWQILPLYETQLERGSLTKHVPSPYKSYGIGIDPRYLPKSLEALQITDTQRQDFVKENRMWINDYALFCALRDHFGTDDWRSWDSDLAVRKPESIERWKIKLQNQIRLHTDMQVKLHRSFKKLQLKAKNNNILLIGDLPFYVTLQSPLVWVNQEIFEIEESGSLRFVSGTPNSKAAHFGRQVWGHPLYNWEKRSSIIAFWKMRLGYLATLYDMIRIDHAKAFFNYGVIDLENSDNDRNEEGPGTELFTELNSYCQQNKLKIFAEDSGEGVHKLRQVMKSLNIPGISIFRFAYDEKKEGFNKEYAEIAKYPANTVVYTSTHDTETLLGYLHKLTVKQKKLLSKEAGVIFAGNDKNLAKIFRKAILNSAAEMIIIPIQDWLLTTERINVPGTEIEANDPNWNFRLKIAIENLPTVR